MKEKAIILVFTLLGLASYGQQGMKFGVQGGIPLENFNDQIGIVLGVDFGHMWALSEVVDAGIMVGYIHGFPEKFGTEDALIDLPSIQFLPISASVRVWTSNSFSFGGEIGQAIGINEGNDGGLYYRPQIAYLMGPNTEVNLSYTTVQLENTSWNTVTLGFLHTLVLKRPY
tara:strand:+ start:70675 stop:71187 length:513 start_codon:yes stop_codon:yes gene_type:complete